MEKGSRAALSCRAAVCGIVALLSATAFSCSVAAEFRKVKEEDMKLDGSLCSLPRSSAFELGVAAIAFLFVAQLVGTTAAVTTYAAKPKQKTAAARGRVAFVALLVLSWLSFAVAVILLATAASMNHGQRYGRGWMDGDCYVARNGVFGGAALLVAVTALITLGLTFATEPTAAAGGRARGQDASRSCGSGRGTTGRAIQAMRQGGWTGLLDGAIAADQPEAAATVVAQKAAPRGGSVVGWRGRGNDNVADGWGCRSACVYAAGRLDI